MTARFRTCGLAALAASIASCGNPHTQARPTGVVVITLDTTRADRLPPYGFASVETPALSGLAARGVVFERAMTVAPLTLPAHASLLTGVYPARHGVRDNSDRFASAQPTLADRLSSHGFRTAASVGSILLARDRGLGHGFQIYRDEIGRTSEGALRSRRPGNEVIDDAIAWLQTVGGEPFFLWVHLYDVHQPYASPEPYGSRYGQMPYLGEIAFADEQVGRLLLALDARGLTARTAIVVAGDHGESLGEHREEAHGLLLYEGTLHVPLIVSAPGLSPRRVASPVSLVDVAPTVLDFLGRPHADMDGISLRALMAGGAAPERSLYAESMFPRRFGWSPLRSIREGRFKFIEAPRPELYDLDLDPDEEHNLYGARPVLAKGLAATLGTPEAVAPAAAVDRSVAERIASLGYASPSMRAPADSAPRQDDPKDHVEAYNEIMRRTMCHSRCDGR
jgi:arylsulfatase A-like enzyme